MSRFAGEQYDLMIVDWKLPDGSGLTIANIAEQVGTKAIVMSGYLFQMPGGRADAQEILMKPIRPGEMLDAVLRAIGQPSGEAGRPQP